ncbi:hypothetical protein [Sulfurovum sp. TSL1]|uniref:hypothetical protein n=1 Tax=Sulfurovum sp. TSL1 TaxID=2826994 RepID=UPI001CC6E2AC|nr:hypothetical protein [Sulfurovum sp. TSL1]GIT98817.1 hypothetical protein TSL1_16380 [Sulfurovum sp. TSL1]
MDMHIMKIEEGTSTLIYLPLTTKNDFYLNLLYIETSEINNKKSNQRFLYEFSLTYNNKPLTRNIINLEEFKATLKCFIDRKMQLDETSKYFIVKEQNKIKSLKFLDQENRYISITEATQMYNILTYTLSKYDLTYEYDKHITHRRKFVSEHYLKRRPNINTDNISVLKFDDYDDHEEMAYKERVD